MNRPSSSASLLLIALSSANLPAQVATTQTSPPTTSLSSSTSSSNQPSVATKYAQLPLSFTANRGQDGPQARFSATGRGYSLFLTDNSAVLALTKPQSGTAPRGQKVASNKASSKDLISVRTDVIRMELIGGATSTPVGVDQLPGTANYFLGNDPAKWHTSVPTYAKVKYNGVYPGVDLVYYGNQRQLEYDFLIAPGADAKTVRLRFAGVSKLKLDGNGDLKVIAKDGVAAIRKPVIYQVDNGQKRPVNGRFKLLARNTLGFQLGNYDHSRELVIDPVLAYSTYLGGSGNSFNSDDDGDPVGDYPSSIAIGADGSAYLDGVAFSVDFPVTSNAFQTINPSRCQAPLPRKSSLSLE